MNLRQKRAAAYQAAHAIIEKAKADGVELTAEQAAEVQKFIDEVKSLDTQIAEALQSEGLLSAIDALGATPDDGGGEKRLAFTGTQIKAVARDAAGRMLGDALGGRKALLPAGELATQVPLQEDPIALGQVATSLLDALPVTVRSTPTYRYLRQTTRTNAAAPVAAGGVKPTSEYGLTPVDGGLHVIAHLSETVDKYLLADATSLGRFVETELLYGLRRAVEAQVLGGNGTTPNLRGLLNTSGIQTQAFATDVLSSTRKAVTALETAGHTASVFVVRPDDWEALEIAAATSAGAIAYRGLPVDRVNQKLWGVPVVVSLALPTKTGLLFDTTALSVSTDSAGIELKWSENTGDDFTKNQVRARCEGRFGVDVFAPLGVVKIATAAA
ncbi:MULTISPECIES: phage major capsid protein [unclassified Gordonia (in: high G+C Gram-positive bacteria)]|uniref:phage major capsid protein n=1 Tax=unclassified Gordonia (in: high G+C Gram-positive bacteria) TaxID=2657482 RepID=UPI00071E41CC|nr:MULTISPECIES: phage major capsid protein [unclassified Gordonia (in: high G+C Gram-positive bacteria)]KSU59651.1 hypothetical protein AS181_06520 [Gordonia sp. SGD-V-85]SCC02795.1 phage major capsid protein, HK97 family [Gordonia sp. v-85]